MGDPPGAQDDLSCAKSLTGLTAAVLEPRSHIGCPAGNLQYSQRCIKRSPLHGEWPTDRVMQVDLPDILENVS